MANSYKNMRDAVKDRIIANWTATPIHWANTRYNPAAGGVQTPWIRPRVVDQGAEQVGIGPTGFNRLIGDVHCSIFVPAGTGDDEAKQYADSFRDLFKRGYILSTASRPMIFGTPEVADAIEDEDWYQVPVVCPFTFDEVP
jgi:hypothetical protein